MELTFKSAVLKVDGLETKFDVIAVSASLDKLIGDRDQATVVQQLNYWAYKGYGVLIEGVRWFYKSIKDWIEEVFPTFSPYKLGKIMQQLCDREIIRREKLTADHHQQQFNYYFWHCKNQTYYYSLNTDKLQEMVKQLKSTQNAVSQKTKILSDQEFKDTKYSDCSKYITENTIKENKARDQIHSQQSAIASVSGTPKAETQDRSASEKKEQQSSSSPATQKRQNFRRVDEKVNLAPWSSKDELQEFYQVLIAALPTVANAHSPIGLAKSIIEQLQQGIPNPYWDDFKNGDPIGTSTMQEWEIKPGIVYPMFTEYLIEKLIKGNNTQTREQARNQVFQLLRQPQRVLSFWGEFKRVCVNVSDQIDRDRALGVTTPNTPVWTQERVEPSIEQAAIAGQNIQGVNSKIEQLKTELLLASNSQPQLESERNNNEFKSIRRILAERGVKGFAKKE